MHLPVFPTACDSVDGGIHKRRIFTTEAEADIKKRCERSEKMRNIARNFGTNRSALLQHMWHFPPGLWKLHISSRIAHFSSYNVLGDSLLSILSSNLIRRKPGTRGPATIQAVEYPIYYNVLRRSLTRCLAHRSFVTVKVLK